VRIAQLADFDDAVKEPVFEIIGLVADAKNRGLQDPVEPEIWVPYTVTGSAFRGILVRTAREPLTMMNAVEHEIWATDANVAVTLTGTLEGYISQFSFAGPRFGFLLMTIFGAIGLVLVTIGVYSVLAYTTVRRTQEIGIRMALGAKGSDVLGLVIRMGLRLVGIGVGLGLIASLALGRVIATQLWECRRTTRGRSRAFQCCWSLPGCWHAGFPRSARQMSIHWWRCGMSKNNPGGSRPRRSRVWRAGGNGYVCR